MPIGFKERVLAVLSALPAGQVVSYGDVAAEAGYPGAARGVGAVLAHSDGLPWWRVVTVTGRLVPGREADHARRLRGEGVAVVQGRVQVRPLPPQPSGLGPVRRR
ncbi:MAG: MGMT family protein [Actinomycetota bacterium]|nr:MGMT family protein [Actinomycetota bacterium]